MMLLLLLLFIKLEKLRPSHRLSFVLRDEHCFGGAEGGGQDGPVELEKGEFPGCEDGDGKMIQAELSVNDHDKVLLGGGQTEKATAMSCSTSATSWRMHRYFIVQ